jgi:sulfite reductase beta subunit-like hemoprotein
MLDELPALIAAGYEQVPEEDIVRLKWWGLYHDKPKIGTFMLRVKIPGGILSPPQLRQIGLLSNLHGRGEAELTTRQNIQLHYLELDALSDMFERLHAAGLTSAGACGDTVRNITGCPVAGLAHDQLFDPTPVLEEAAARFYGNPDYSDLPRKHKISITACADSCAAPEINCVGLVGALRDREEGFAVLVGGGLSSVPRIARELGIWVPKGEAVTVLAAILDEWREDLRYRVSRVKARLKFMIDDIGPEGMRERVEERLGRKLADFALPEPQLAPRDHLGVHPQKQPGLAYIGVPVHLGLLSGEQMVGVADIAERAGADVRITRQQNFIVANVPVDRVDGVIADLAAIGLSLEVNGVRGRAIGCTGEPHCNFSVTETKQRLGRLIEHLEARFGDAISTLGLQLDGCPHACAQHWIADLGFQGTTARDADGKRVQAYDIFVRGGLAPDAQIGKALFRRVPSAELDAAVAGLIQGWLDGRDGDEPFPAFARRQSDEELGAAAGLEPVKGRVREEEAA